MSGWSEGGWEGGSRQKGGRKRKRKRKREIRNGEVLTLPSPYTPNSTGGVVVYAGMAYSIEASLWLQ